jgi:uncharacterized membrane protein YphA (DoxX/SURF4 family)
MADLPRPGVTWLAISVLTFTGWQGLRLWRAFDQGAFITSLPLPVPASYYQISAIVWALAGLALLAGLIARQRWFFKSLPGITLGYVAFIWAERLWLGSETVQSNSVFMIVFSIIFVSSAFLALALPGVQHYFGESDERTEQSQD